MVDYREILRLDYENFSLRSVAASIQGSLHTVSDTLKAAKEKHIEWPLDETVTNAQLEELLFPDKYYSRNNYLTPNFEQIHKELAKPAVQFSATKVFNASGRTVQFHAPYSGCSTCAEYSVQFHAPYLYYYYEGKSVGINSFQPCRWHRTAAVDRRTG